VFTYPLEPVDIKSFGSLVFINLVMLVENFNTSLGSLLDFLNTFFLQETLKTPLR
jgi:hypothetical protein